MKELIDLTSQELGGYVLAATDGLEGARQNLNRTEPGPITGGWQTQRRRDSGHDWAVIRLGTPGTIEEVIIDTSGFRGDHPERASLEGCVAPHNALVEELDGWTEIVAPTTIAGNKENRFGTGTLERFTHLRLNIYPDGCVARLQVFGRPVPDWMTPGFHPAGLIDLVAARNGGAVHSASDLFIGAPGNLILPGQATHRTDGWMTRRRREPGLERAVFRLVGASEVRALTIDTAHFSGDHPSQVQVDGSCGATPEGDDWFELLPAQTLLPHTCHEFQQEIVPNAGVRWVRLNLIPDGGLSRFRVWGDLTEDSLIECRLTFLNSSSSSTLARIFKQVCHADKWVSRMVEAAPFSDLDDLLKKGDQAWSGCQESDWRQAIEGHPRIGEKAKGKSLSSAWSRGEQSKASAMDTDIAERLSQTQRKYDEKFGFIFLICATGLSSEQILKAVEQRLENSMADELQNVAKEQAKIIQLRLEKLLK